MSASTADLRDLCRLLGGLTLEGAREDLLREIQREGTAAKLGAVFGDDLGAALTAMQSALADDELQVLTAEYTRLMVANADRGARSSLPVPPWEDCYVGGERQVKGPRSQATLKAYAAAALGFEGLKERPADHVGLELCFVAALLEEELQGLRDDSSRAAFVAEHLTTFSPAIGRALADATQMAFWREAGNALVWLPSVLRAHAS